jgi:hypothetical protein
MHPRLRPRRGRRRPLLFLLAGLLLLAATATCAQAATVTSGHLDWATANVYDSAAPANTNRTWLGYVTGPPPLAAGSASASGGATGDDVTTTSPRGADTIATFGFPLASGTYDPASGSGSIELRGTVTFASTAHGFTITLQDPKLVLAGSSGQLFASGQGSTSQGASTYDRSSPVFDLDLSAATTTDWPDGSRTIAGIVPRLATADYVFPPNYAAGAGPDRTPNTFGAFAVTLSSTTPSSPANAGTSPQTGASTPAGAVALGRLTGKAHGGTKARKRVVVTLSRVLAANPTKSYKIKLTAHGRTIATGTLHGRTLTLNVRKGRFAYHRIKGVFTIRAASKHAKLTTTKVHLG